MKFKQEVHQDKCLEVNNSIENVRERYKHLSKEDSSLRLRKLGMMTSQSKRLSRNESSRALSTSNSQHHRDLLWKVNQDREVNLVTKYLNKIERSESRVLLKELDNEKRIMTSKKSRVKCLVEQRNEKQVERMLKAEKEYNQRMEIFEISNMKTQHQKESTLLNRSLINLNNYKMAAKRRFLMRTNKEVQGYYWSQIENRTPTVRKRICCRGINPVWT